MADNLQITRVEKNRNGDGTSVYYTFAFPVTQDNMDGYVVLDNGTYLSAMREGTIEDPNMGLYTACMEKIISDITLYLPVKEEVKEPDAPVEAVTTPKTDETTDTDTTAVTDTTDVADDTKPEQSEVTE